MGELDYWQRFWKRRLSRRLVLRGALWGGAGLAAAAVVGCDGGSQEKATGTPAASATATAAGVTPVGSRGGTLHLMGIEAFPPDTLDPHQSQYGPIYSAHSSVFSKVLRYESVEDGVIVPDLATAMPEMPDQLTYIIRLRPGVRFQQPSKALGGSPSSEEQLIGGRELTAEDVKYSFERQVNENSPRRSLFVRASQFTGIESIRIVDPLTLEIRTKRPIAPFIHFLANTNSFIIPREVVDDTDQMNRPEAMIGTGPFIWKEQIALQVMRMVRNPDWFGWGEPEVGRPYIDGYESLFIYDDASIEAAFRTKKLDSAFQVSNAQWVKDLREQEPSLTSADTGFAAWVKAAFIVDQPPYSDLKLRKAIHLATDRRQIVDALWQGYGRAQGPVSWVLKRWALPEEELLSLPGYRVGTQERQEDEQEARRLYEAAGSPELFITFGDQPGYVPQFAPQYKRKLEEVLGAKVDYQVRSYAILNEGTVRGTMPFTWRYDNGWIDLDDWVYPHFHSAGSANVAHVSDAQLDSLLDAQRATFDFEERQQLGYQIQRYLLENVLAWLDFASYYMLWVAWPYYKNFRPASFFGDSFHMANAWLDRSDPVWGSRA
jgi:peptide/nickel transport system substrate-binding protein